jgi:hypothetical protein
MKRAVVLTLSLSLTIAIAQAPPGRAMQGGSVFESFRSSLSRLRDKLGTGDVKATEWLNKIDSSVAFLKGFTASNSNKEMPEEYLKSLKLNADLLKTLAEKRYSPDPKFDRTELYQGLEDVASDLEIKVATIKRSRGDAVKLIEVIVRAKKGEQEVGGFEVWYVPRGWANNPGQYRRFDSLSNPNNPPSMNLAPGNYLMWLNKGKDATERQPVRIGGDGRVKREFDLVVP